MVAENLLELVKNLDSKIDTLRHLFLEKNYCNSRRLKPKNFKTNSLLKKE